MESQQFTRDDLIRFIDNLVIVCQYKQIETIQGTSPINLAATLRNQLIINDEPIYRVYYRLIVAATNENITMAELAAQDAFAFQQFLAGP